MEIRQIREGDFTGVIQCIHRALQISNARDYPKEVIRIQVEEHYTLKWIKETVLDKYYIVADLDNKIVGTGSLFEDELRNIFIDPDYQRKGIGRSITFHLEEIAKNKGYSEVWLVSSITARSYYLSLEYEEVVEVDEEIGDMKTIGYLMRKNLC